MTFEDHFIDNNGVRIHYEVNDDAPGDAPPLVLMHGMGGSTKNWHNAGYRRPSQVSSGLSSSTRGASARATSSPTPRTTDAFRRYPT